MKKLIHQNMHAYTLVIGEKECGKSTLLSQSELESHSIENELITEVYCNTSGIILELGDNILNDNLYANQVIRRFNKIDSNLKISGILLCIDIQKLFTNNQEIFYK